MAITPTSNSPVVEQNVGLLLDSWKRLATPLRIEYVGALGVNRVELRGRLLAASDEMLEFTTSSDVAPRCIFTLPLSGATTMTKYGFEEAAKANLGAFFESLQLGQSGGALVERFECAVVIQYRSGARCILAKLPVVADEEPREYRELA